MGRGVAGLAPQIGVLPVRLYWTTVADKSGFSAASVMNALVALRKVFDNGKFVEKVSVTNSSFGSKESSGPGTLSWRIYDKWYSRDALACDRLHVASAGNAASESLQAPAALGVVLGVSGLVCTQYGASWFPYISPTPATRKGSTYWNDRYLSPELRYYPVSGVYGFTDINHAAFFPLGITTASPQVLNDPSTHYRDFNGTSFASPQVAALAALLRKARPSATYNDVAARIVQTRDTIIENQMWNQYQIPLAGLVDYDAALANW
jgi:subtilisin family serine protease